MAFELSVNLEYMFHEAGDRLEDRIAAAAQAGFAKVEMFTTAGRDVASLARALADNGAEMLTMLVDPRTRLIDPETHAGFRDLFRQAARDAAALASITAAPRSLALHTSQLSNPARPIANGGSGGNRSFENAK